MKILVMGDSAYGTSGFARVALNVCNLFSDLGHEVVQAGWNFGMRPMNMGKFTIVSSSPPVFGNDYGKLTFNHWLKIFFFF